MQITAKSIGDYGVEKIKVEKKYRYEKNTLQFLFTWESTKHFSIQRTTYET
jgi:hypothetical protein